MLISRLTCEMYVVYEPLWKCERCWYYIANEAGEPVSYFGPTPHDAWCLVYLHPIDDIAPGDEITFS